MAIIGLVIPLGLGLFELHGDEAGGRGGPRRAGSDVPDGRPAGLPGGFQDVAQRRRRLR